MYDIPDYLRTPTPYALRRRAKRRERLRLLALLALSVLMLVGALTPSVVTYERSNYTVPDPCELAVVICEGEEEVIYKGKASITKYEWTGQPMANGEYPHIGAVAVSDRDIPLGSIAIVSGNKYVVKDRTAEWVHQKHGLTVDIYSTDTPQEMLRYGRKTKDVIILYNDKVQPKGENN